MQMSDNAAFALRGERGLDVFRRIEDKDQRRHHYECVATVKADGTVQAFADFARNHPRRVKEAVSRYDASALKDTPLMLAASTSYPVLHNATDNMDLFQYLDFLRIWQVAQMALDRFEARVKGGQAPEPPDISPNLRLVWNLNHLSRAQRLIQLVSPFLDAVVTSGKDDKWQNAGYALRMIGDLHLRLDAPDKALSAYEASLSLGQNPFRRALAIRAAHSAGNLSAMREHLALYAARWDLPDDLRALQSTTSEHEQGDA